MSRRIDAAALALDGIQGFSDHEREAMVELLKIGRGRVSPGGEGSARPVSSLAERGFTWPEFDRWQAFFTARGAFPVRWEGLHVVPAPQTSATARAAYQQRKLDLLFEWLDTLTRRATTLGHYTRQGLRARIVPQGDGRPCPACESFSAHEVTPGSDALPPFHPGCRCVLMAVPAAPRHERNGALARYRSRA